MKERNLPLSATLEDILEAVRKYKDSIPKIKMPEFKTLQKGDRKNEIENIKQLMRKYNLM